MLPSEETVGGVNLPSTVTLTKKEAIMRKVKLIVHETYQGKRKSEDVFAAVFLSNAVVGLSMMCYTLGKAERICKGERQASGLIGKLLY